MCKFTFCLVSCPSASDASLGETKTLYADVCSRVSSQVRKMGKRAMRAVLTSEFYCCQARRTCPSKCCRACLHAYTHGSTGWDSFFHGVTCSGTFEHSLCMLPNTINFPADRCLQFYIEAAVCIQSCLIQWFYSCLTEATFGYSLQQPLSYEVAYSCQAVCLLCFSEIHFGKKNRQPGRSCKWRKECIVYIRLRTEHACCMCMYVLYWETNRHCTGICSVITDMCRYTLRIQHVPVSDRDGKKEKKETSWSNCQTIAEPVALLEHIGTLVFWWQDAAGQSGSSLVPDSNRHRYWTDTSISINFPRRVPASHSEAICRHRADSRKNGRNGQGIWFDP